MCNSDAGSLDDRLPAFMYMLKKSQTAALRRPTLQPVLPPKNQHGEARRRKRLAATTDHTFVCWKCGCDLTKNVQEEEELSTRVFRTVRNKNRSGFGIALQKAQKLLLPDSKEWRIQVLCPQEGTANIFSSEARRGRTTLDKVRGYAKLRIVVGVKDGGKLKTLAMASAIPSTRTICIQPIR